MTIRITTTKPRRYGSTMGYALHAATVTVRGATAEQIAVADDLAASFAGTQRDAMRPGRYRVRQAPLPEGGRYAYAAGADEDHVATKAARLAETLRRALTSPAKEPA